MRDFIYKNRKKMLIAGILIFVFIVAISVYFIITDRAKSATVDIMVTPTIAKVKIGEESFGVMGEYRIKPGEYNVEVSAEGFLTEMMTIKAEEGEVSQIQIYLEPTEDNTNWYNDHPDDALILGEIKNNYIIRAVQELKDEYPILNQLPLEIDYFTSGYAKRVKYTISYELNGDNTGFKITIRDYTGGNYDDAIAKLTARGIDTEEYDIEYLDESDDLVWGEAR